MAGRSDMLALLGQKGIEYREERHRAVFTMEEMEEAGIAGHGRIAKNLFLRDDRKRSYYLVSVRPGMTVDLKALRHIIPSRPLSFASEEDLWAILGLSKGEVTPFGLLSDSCHRAVFVMDSFFTGGIIGIHPCDNTSTVFLRSEDLLSVLRESGTECVIAALQHEAAP